MKTGYPSIDKPWMKYYNISDSEASFPQCTLNDYLWASNQDHLDNIAMSYYGCEVSYRQLFERIEDASAALSAFGVQCNDRIMFLMPNIPETTYLFYGSSRIGAVSDFIDLRPDSFDLEASINKTLMIIEDEKPQFIVALDQCYFGLLKSAEDRLAVLGINGIIVVCASDSMDTRAKITYLSEILSTSGIRKTIDKLKKQSVLQKATEQAIRSAKIKTILYTDLIAHSQGSRIEAIPYQSNRLEIIVHTSGTSGLKPKPIPLTNDNLNAYVHQTFSANMPMKRGDKALHVLPFFAAYGVVDVVHAGLCHGNHLVQVPEFLTTEIGRLIKRYKPQIVIGAPTWFLSMIHDKSLNSTDLSFLTMITYGGDSLEVADEERINHFLHEHNCKTKITKGHGMSETCGCASYAIGPYNELGSIGIPMPNTLYAVVDPESKELLCFKDDVDYIEGELAISSKTVTSGILDGKVIVPHRTYHGEDFILTRDIARMRKDGLMTFLSRSDRSFTRYDGYKIKPYEIENIIKSFPEVQYCVIYPHYDSAKLGNMPSVYIVMDTSPNGKDFDAISCTQSIIQRCFINNPEASVRQIPSIFRYGKELPITKNGKIDFNSIAQENECLEISHVFVEIEETNLSVGQIHIH